MGVDNQSEISFLVPQGTLPWQPNFVGFRAWVSLGGLMLGFAVHLIS